MKNISLYLIAGLLLGFSAVFVGCEWESTEEGFNTSQGAGALVNFSGVYRSKTAAPLVGTTVTQLVILQTGNTLEVWDNNNSYYKGSVGSPGIVGTPDAVTGSYPSGATMVQAQVNFAGVNADTGETVTFVGVLHAVAVNDVRGTTSSTTTTVSTNASDSLSFGSGGYTNTTTTANNTQTQSGATTTYSITEANTQYVLDGNWIEGGGGGASTVISAISPASSGLFTTTTPAAGGGGAAP
jgi:hypothetical protein